VGNQCGQWCVREMSRLRVHYPVSHLLAQDLHKFNAAMACSAVRSFFDALLARGVDSRVDDALVIIVGKGLRSEKKAKLLPFLHALLSDDYGITAEVDPDNTGRLVVKAECLQAVVDSRNWS
jgi:hypothetical protein